MFRLLFDICFFIEEKKKKKNKNVLDTFSHSEVSQKLWHVRLPEPEPGLCCSAGMRWWLVAAILWLLVVLTIPHAQAKNKPTNQDVETRKGKKKDGQGKSAS